VTTTVNGKTALSFDGANDGLNFTGTARTDETWIIAAAQIGDSAGQDTLVNDGGNGFGISASRGSTRLVEASFGPGYDEGVHRLRATYSSNAATPFGPGVISVVRSAAAGGFVFIDGTQRVSGVNGALSFTTSASQTMQRIGYYNTTTFQWQGWIGEILCYSRALTAAERNAAELYLGRKWGITVTQVPSVSNADAQDWINRVYSNGGTVSASTASAVNTFCNDIDAASIRDRFYRLNLLCGTGLNAALVPLYRGQSRTGTQYGNTTDTNSNFVSGDYVETGSTGGLVGNGTNKRLDTGINGSSLSAGDRHCSAYEMANATTDYSPSVLSGNALATMHGVGPWTTASTYAYRTFNSVGGNITAAKNTGYWLGNDTSTTASVLYRNGASAASTTGQSAGGSGNTTYQILGNASGEYSEARIGAYTIGLSMSAAQVSSLYTAMQAFQTSLGRNV
jgi:hypothetical protein